MKGIRPKEAAEKRAESPSIPHGEIHPDRNEQLCPGAPRSHQRTWDENDFLRLLSAGLTPTELFESFADLQETGFLADKVRDGFPPTDQPGSLAFDQDLGWAGPGVVI